MSALLQEIISLIVGGLSSMATGIGTGLSQLVKGIFVVESATTAGTYSLTTFGGIVIIFAGISLAFGLCRWVMSFVTSLGSFN